MVPVTVLAVLVLGHMPGQLEANPLEDYLAQADATFAWKKVSEQKTNGVTVVHLELTSQTWRGIVWKHHLRIVRPAVVRNPDLAFLFITGDGSGRGQLSVLRTVAERAGVVAAVVTQVPNQPLFDGREEDALIAYTFDQYVKTGDKTWPLLLPMVKSAVRAMDCVQAVTREESGQEITRFVVGGASKRGWTTWLTGATDRRVKAITPMVIDMLNMSVQTKWAQKAYGRQSEQIHDYTDLNLVERLDEPRMVELRQFVDPYSYAERYTMPKLLLLGTNDPYWVVDSLRHYWDALPAPKLVFQTPNAGHDLGGGEAAVQSLAAFVQIIADRGQLPTLRWEFKRTDTNAAQLTLSVDQQARQILLWTADSKDRDFRNDQWTSRELEIKPGSSRATVEVTPPPQGYRAYMGEVILQASTGQTYRLSTEARVVPDDL